MKKIISTRPREETTPINFFDLPEDCLSLIYDRLSNLKNELKRGIDYLTSPGIETPTPTLFLDAISLSLTSRSGVLEIYRLKTPFVQTCINTVLEQTSITPFEKLDKLCRKYPTLRAWIANQMLENSDRLLKTIFSSSPRKLNYFLNIVGPRLDSNLAEKLLDRVCQSPIETRARDIEELFPKIRMHITLAIYYKAINSVPKTDPWLNVFATIGTLARIAKESENSVLVEEATRDATIAAVRYPSPGNILTGLREDPFHRQPEEFQEILYRFREIPS